LNYQDARTHAINFLHSLTIKPSLQLAVLVHWLSLTSGQPGTLPISLYDFILIGEHSKLNFSTFRFQITALLPSAY